MIFIHLSWSSWSSWYGQAVDTHYWTSLWCHNIATLRLISASLLPVVAQTQHHRHGRHVPGRLDPPRPQHRCPLSHWLFGYAKPAFPFGIHLVTQDISATDAPYRPYNCCMPKWSAAMAAKELLPGCEGIGCPIGLATVDYTNASVLMAGMLYRQNQTLTPSKCSGNPSEWSIHSFPPKNPLKFWKQVAVCWKISAEAGLKSLG